MANMTLDQDKQRFGEWRSRRNGREAIPEDLWRLACRHIPSLGITRVAREFRLNDSKLREKAAREGVSLARLGRQNSTQPGKVAKAALAKHLLAASGLAYLQHPGAWLLRQSLTDGTTLPHENPSG